MGYGAIVAKGPKTRDQPDPKSSNGNTPCNNKSIWLCMMSLFGLAKLEPNNEILDVNHPTDDLGTTDDRQEQTQPRPAESTEQPKELQQGPWPHKSDPSRGQLKVQRCHHHHGSGPPRGLPMITLHNFEDDPAKDPLMDRPACAPSPLRRRPPQPPTSLSMCPPR